MAALRVDDSKPDEFMNEIRERLAEREPNDQILLAIVNLTAGTDAFLTEEGFAPNGLFIKRWPSNLDIMGNEKVMHAFIALITTAKDRDSRLQRCADKLVPKKASESDFWWRYFGNVATLLSNQPSTQEQLFSHLSNLPPRRPVEERAFAPMSKLQISGRMKREEILRFLTLCKEVCRAARAVWVVRGGVVRGGRELTVTAGDMRRRGGGDGLVGCAERPGRERDKGGDLALHRLIPSRWYSTPAQRAR